MKNLKVAPLLLLKTVFKNTRSTSVKKPLTTYWKTLLCLTLVQTLANLSFAQQSTNSTPLTIADGGGSTNGGDTRCCKEYSKIVGQVAYALVKIGNDKVQAESPLVSVDKLWNIKQKLRCIPATNLDRQARSDSQQLITWLDVKKWDALKSDYAKTKLITHELAVLAEYESDGEYLISNDIDNVLRKYPNDLRGIMFGRFAELVTINPDNTIFLYKPFVEISDKRYFLVLGNSTLKFKSFECRALGLNPSQSEGSYSNYESSLHANYVTINSNGNVTAITNNSEALSENMFAKSIMCQL